MESILDDFNGYVDIVSQLIGRRPQLGIIDPDGSDVILIVTFGYISGNILEEIASVRRSTLVFDEMDVSTDMDDYWVSYEIVRRGNYILVDEISDSYSIFIIRT